MFCEKCSILGPFLSIYCKQSMYSMFEAKLQNCPLTNLNKYVYNGKSEIKVYMYTHTHTRTYSISKWKCWCWIIHLQKKTKELHLPVLVCPFKTNNGLEEFGVKTQIQRSLLPVNIRPKGCPLYGGSTHTHTTKFECPNRVCASQYPEFILCTQTHIIKTKQN
jgi:hypothetical protein